MSTETKLTIELQLLEHDTYTFQAQRHWSAGRSWSRTRRYAMFSLIIINALSASNVWLNIVQDQTVIHSLVTLGSTIISAWILQFKPEETMAGHKNVANRFSALARQARILQHRISEGDVDSKEGWAEFEVLRQNYENTKQLAENYHVDERITREIYKRTESKRQAIQAQLSKQKGDPNEII